MTLYQSSNRNVYGSIIFHLTGNGLYGQVVITGREESKIDDINKEKIVSILKHRNTDEVFEKNGWVYCATKFGKNEKMFKIDI